MLSRGSFSAKSALVTGRNLIKRAHEVCAKMKKVLAFIHKEQLLNDNGTPKDSGKTMVDVDNEILNYMYKICQKTNLDNEIEDIVFKRVQRTIMQ